MVFNEKIPHSAFRIPHFFPTFAPAKGELSSVGLEHRPYKAGVVGSSPTVPTEFENNPLISTGYFLEIQMIIISSQTS